MTKKKFAGAIGLMMAVGLFAFTQSENTVQASVSSESVDVSSESSSSSSSAANDTSAVSDTETEGRKKVDIKETGDVLIDADGFYAEITNKTTDEFGYLWTIHCENNTGNTVFFGMENVSVNGVMAVPLFGTEVESGSSAESDATWHMDLSEFGIETPVIIEGTIVVFDSKTYSLIKSEDFVVCPEGEDAAYYEVREELPEDKEIIKNDYVNFIYSSFRTDEYDNIVMDIYLNNKSDKDIIVSIDGCFMNDAEADPFWAAFLPSEKSVYTGIYWPIADLQAVGIDSLEKISKLVAEISVYDQESYETYSNDTIILNF